MKIFRSNKLTSISKPIKKEDFQSHNINIRMIYIHVPQRVNVICTLLTTCENCFHINGTFLNTHTM